MGGRGSAGGVFLGEKQYRRLEDSAQRNDAIQNGIRARARYYEYTDSTGKVHRGETGANTPGGTYRAAYNEQIAAYSRQSTQSLEKERETLKRPSNDQYQRFARSAASKSASQVRGFADADAKIRMIDQILSRRRRNRK